MVPSTPDCISRMNGDVYLLDIGEGIGMGVLCITTDSIHSFSRPPNDSSI